MNYRMIARILGMVLLILAALLVLPLIAGLCYGENVLNFAVTIAAAAALGGIFMLFKPKNRDIYAREGFTAVGLSWILMSLIGALPFVISGDIPSYVDALFETVSGFTAALACISNIGPGMGQIGPASCFNIFSAPVKMVLAVIMLLGRLELYPILAFLAPTTWRK